MDNVELKAIAIVLHAKVSLFLIDALNTRADLPFEEKKNLALSVLCSCLAEATSAYEVDPDHVQATYRHAVETLLKDELTNNFAKGILINGSQSNRRQRPQ